jgi:hypothetical protein
MKLSDCPSFMAMRRLAGPGAIPARLLLAEEEIDSLRKDRAELARLRGSLSQGFIAPLRALGRALGGLK